MFRRILLVIAASLTFAAPLSAVDTQKTENAFMTLLRRDGVQLGCGIGAALCWLTCVVAQRRFSRLGTSGYPQRQRRIALREQLESLSRVIAQAKLAPTPVHTSVEDGTEAMPAIRQPDIAHQYLQKLDMLERQLSMVDQEINALNSKVDTTNTIRQLSFLLALTLTGAAVAPWLKKAPEQASSGAGASDA